MWLKFNDGIAEYSNGEYHRVNDGKPFDVDGQFGEELLKSGHFTETTIPVVEKAPEPEVPVIAKKRKEIN